MLRTVTHPIQLSSTNATKDTIENNGYTPTTPLTVGSGSIPFSFKLYAKRWDGSFEQTYSNHTWYKTYNITDLNGTTYSSLESFYTELVAILNEKWSGIIGVLGSDAGINSARGTANNSYFSVQGTGDDAEIVFTPVYNTISNTTVNGRWYVYDYRISLGINQNVTATGNPAWNYNFSLTPVAQVSWTAQVPQITADTTVVTGQPFSSPAEYVPGDFKCNSYTFELKDSPLRIPEHATNVQVCLSQCSIPASWQGWTQSTTTVSGSSYTTTGRVTEPTLTTDASFDVTLYMEPLIHWSSGTNITYDFDLRVGSATTSFANETTQEQTSITGDTYFTVPGFTHFLSDHMQSRYQKWLLGLSGKDTFDIIKRPLWRVTRFFGPGTGYSATHNNGDPNEYYYELMVNLDDFKFWTDQWTTSAVRVRVGWAFSPNIKYYEGDHFMYSNGTKTSSTTMGNPQILWGINNTSFNFDAGVRVIQRMYEADSVFKLNLQGCTIPAGTYNRPETLESAMNAAIKERMNLFFGHEFAPLVTEYGSDDLLKIQEVGKKWSLGANVLRADRSRTPHRLEFSTASSELAALFGRSGTYAFDTQEAGSLHLVDGSHFTENSQQIPAVIYDRSNTASDSSAWGEITATTPSATITTNVNPKPVIMVSSNFVKETHIAGGHRVLAPVVVTATSPNETFDYKSPGNMWVDADHNILNGNLLTVRLLDTDYNPLEYTEGADSEWTMEMQVRWQEPIEKRRLEQSATETTFR